MVELICTKQSITEEEFHEFEKLFGVKIPDSFKNHYLHSNGGFPDEKDANAGKWGLPVGGFFPIKYGNMTIESNASEAIYPDPCPEYEKFGSWQKFEYIPFAYDYGGNPIFMSVRKNDFGSIYIYSPDGDNIALIYPSFEEFRARLYKIEA